MIGASAVFSPEHPVPGSFCIPENACRIIALFYYPTLPRQPLSFCRKKKFFILPFHQNGVTRMKIPNAICSLPHLTQSKACGFVL